MFISYEKMQHIHEECHARYEEHSRFIRVWAQALGYRITQPMLGHGDYFEWVAERSVPALPAEGSPTNPRWL